MSNGIFNYVTFQNLMISATATTAGDVCSPEQYLAQSINWAVQAIQADINNLIANGTPLNNLGQYEVIQGTVMDDIIFNEINQNQFVNYREFYNCQRFDFNDETMQMPNAGQRDYFQRNFNTVFDDLAVAGRVTAACWP